MKVFSKTSKFSLKLGYILIVVTLISLFLLSQATQNSKEFENYYKPLLITIFIGIILLFIIVALLLRKILINNKKAVVGASLSLSIFIKTLLIALSSLFFVSFFSFMFLGYEFQSSFDKGINNALTNALTISKRTLRIKEKELIEISKIVANTIAPFEYKKLQNNLEIIRRNINADELTVFDEKGFIQALSSTNLHNVVPALIPEYSDFFRLENERAISFLRQEKGKIKVGILTNINKLGVPNYYLQSVFTLPYSISSLTNQINKTVSERDKFNYLMPKVNKSFIFVLLLVLLLTLLSSVLLSIKFANEMVQPIKDLIKGTKNVSKGFFSEKVLVKRKDDFGTLINSFNKMTNSLKIATEEADKNKQKVENERVYLATIINSMSSAVITLDYKKRLLTFNERAEKLLDCNLSEAININRKNLKFNLENYKNFINQLIVKDKEIETEIEITHLKEIKRFIVRITSLPSADNLHGGYVVIFDDLGHYLQKQKQAAWEEVARRLAHEIKNPLTPILLATERLNYKLSKHLPKKEQQVLSRSVDVISNQVNSLKNVVDDFSDYAKPISTKKRNIYLNELLKDIFELYKGNIDTVSFDLHLKAKNDEIFGNNNLLRQLFHNVIKNAIEACEKAKNGKIVITSFNLDNNVVVSIDDNGTGLTDNKDIFEPYFTTKEKGTGLGLAIVDKIVNEHNGNINLKNKTNKQGVKVILTFPMKNEK